MMDKGLEREGQVTSRKMTPEERATYQAPVWFAESKMRVYVSKNMVSISRVLLKDMELREFGAAQIGFLDGSICLRPTPGGVESGKLVLGHNPLVRWLVNQGATVGVTYVAKYDAGRKWYVCKEP